jgi:rod shape-determining protein MreC
VSQWFNRTKLIVILLVVIIIAGSIHFTSSSRSQVTVFEQAVRDVLAPIQKLFMRISRSVNSLLTSIGQIGSLQEENAALKAQVLELEQQLYQMAEYKRENEWLREALEFKKQEAYQMQICEVIGRSPTNLFSSITINRGRNHEVTQGMPVMSGNGVVGTVQSVTATTAAVILATDPRSAIGGMVQDTGDLVLIEGDPDYSGMLLAKPLSKDVELEQGDILVTSGLSQYFPKGMPIGEVVEIIPSRYQLSFTAYVRPFVDFSRLEYVFVLSSDAE